MVRVGVVEEKSELPLMELTLQRELVRDQLLGQLRVALGKLGQLFQVSDPALELPPGRYLLPVFGSLAGQGGRPARIVPGVRCPQLLLQLVGAKALVGEVKDAPSARGSAGAAPRAYGWDGYLPWHRLYLRPEPHQQRSLRPSFLFGAPTPTGSPPPDSIASALGPPPL